MKDGVDAEFSAGMIKLNRTSKMRLHHTPYVKEFHDWANPFVHALGDDHPPGCPVHDPNSLLLTFPERAQIILTRVQKQHPEWSITSVSYPPKTWEVTCPNCLDTFTASPKAPHICEVCMAGILLENKERGIKENLEKTNRWAELQSIQFKNDEKRRIREGRKEEAQAAFKQAETAPKKLTFGVDALPDQYKKKRKKS